MYTVDYLNALKTKSLSHFLKTGAEEAAFLKYQFAVMASNLTRFGEWTEENQLDAALAEARLTAIIEED